MRGLSFGLALRARPPRGGAAPPAPAISAVHAEGWSVQWATGTPPTFSPDTAPQTIALSRAGFDGDAQPTLHAATRTFTRRRRRPWPDHASDTPAAVALDDYVYATDTIPGVANLSTETSPRPVAAWAMPHRRVVGDTIALEVVAFHRDARAGRMVASVRFLATDGTITVSQVVSATTLSTRPGDQQPLPVFACTLNVAALTQGPVTVQAAGDAAARLDLQWEDVAFDNAGVSGNWLSRSDNHFYGAVFSNLAGSTLGASANGEQRIMRGVAADLVDIGWENWVTLASTLTRAGSGAVRDATRGAIAFQNRFLNPNPVGTPLGIAAASAGDIVTGFWAVQNLIELTRASAGPMIRISSDAPAFGNTDHCGLGRNTVTGQGSAGRSNLFYDNDTGGVRRLHRRMWHQGDILVQANVKGDVDIGDAAALGHLAYQHGVGCRGNLTQFRVNTVAPHVEAQAFPGQRSLIGTSTSVRNDPGFVDYRGVSAAGAGTGGGDYRLQPSAAARAIVDVAALSHDLAGLPRPMHVRDSAGAYV